MVLRWCKKWAKTGSLAGPDLRKREGLIKTSEDSYSGQKMISASISVMKKHTLAFFCSISNPIKSSKTRLQTKSLYSQGFLYVAFSSSGTAPLKAPVLSSVKNLGEACLKWWLQAFILSEDFPSSLTSPWARRLVLYLECNCLLLATRIKLCLSQRNTGNHREISPMPRELGEMRKLQDISPPESHETILPLQTGPLLFSPNILNSDLSQISKSLN